MGQQRNYHKRKQMSPINDSSSIEPPSPAKQRINPSFKDKGKEPLYGTPVTHITRTQSESESTTPVPINNITTAAQDAVVPAYPSSSSSSSAASTSASTSTSTTSTARVPPQSPHQNRTSAPVHQSVLVPQSTTVISQSNTATQQTNLSKQVQDWICPFCQKKFDKKKSHTEGKKDAVVHSAFVNHLKDCAAQAEKLDEALRAIELAVCMGTPNKPCPGRKVVIPGKYDRCGDCNNRLKNAPPSTTRRDTVPPVFSQGDSWSIPITSTASFNPAKGIIIDEHLTIDAIFLNTHFRRSTPIEFKGGTINDLKLEYSRLIAASNRGVPGAHLFRDLFWLAMMHPRPSTCKDGFNKHFNDKLSAWRSGNYRSLLTLCGLDLTALNSPQIRPQNPIFDRETQIENLVTKGQLSKAARIAVSNGIAPPGDPASLPKVQSKFPRRDYDITVRVDPNTSSVQVKDLDELKEHTGRLNRFAAPGLGGFRASHLKAFLATDCAPHFEHNYLIFINRILAGDLSDIEREHLLASEIVALYKEPAKENSNIERDVRPVAISSIHRRLASSIALTKVTEKANKVFDKMYFGGRKIGADIMCHSLRIISDHFADIDDLNWVLDLDAQNAFGLANRDTILSGFHADFPEIYRYIKMCYDNKSNMIFGQHSFVCDNGVLQGDPLSTLAFNFIVRALRNDVAPICGNAKIFSYVDDLVITGPAQDVTNIYRRIREEGKTWGYHLQPSKCRLSQPNPNVAYPAQGYDDLVGVLKGISKDNNGLLKVERTQEILGIPLALQKQSNEEKLRQANELVQSILAKLRQVNWTKLNAHCSYHILKMCLAYPAINYHLRLIPNNLWCDTLLDFDRNVMSAFIDLAGLKDITINDPDKTRIALPIRLSGMGIRAAQTHASAAHLASLSATKTHIEEIIDDLNGARVKLDTLYSSAVNNWKQISNTTTAQLPDEMTQKSLSGIIDKLQYNNHMLHLEQTAPNRAESFKASNGSCFHLLPTFDDVDKLSNDEFSGMVIAYLQLHLNMVPPPPATLKCSTASKTNPDYSHSVIGCAQCCKITARHDTTASVFARFARDSNQHGSVSCTPKKHALFDSKGNECHPGDVCINRCNNSHKKRYLDFTIVDPISSTRSEGRKTLEQVYSKAISAKISKYEELFARNQDIDFNPIVCAAYGRIAPKSIEVLRGLINKDQLNLMLKHMSFSILRFSGAALFKHYITSRKPPLRTRRDV